MSDTCNDIANTRSCCINKYSVQSGVKCFNIVVFISANWSKRAKSNTHNIKYFHTGKNESGSPESSFSIKPVPWLNEDLEESGLTKSKFDLILI